MNNMRIIEKNCPYCNNHGLMFLPVSYFYMCFSCNHLIDADGRQYFETENKSKEIIQIGNRSIAKKIFYPCGIEIKLIGKLISFNTVNFLGGIIGYEVEQWVMDK